jgi:hypothetical protein
MFGVDGGVVGDGTVDRARVDEIEGFFRKVEVDGPGSGSCA